jgi:hypothetical protein
MKIGNVKILYRNHQWMVQEEPRGKFIVEVNERNPDDTGSGYWMHMQDLMHLRGNGTHSMIQHVCEKTWVDIDAFEQAVLYAFLAFDMKPDYDVSEQFAISRRQKNEEFSYPWTALNDYA